MSASVKGGKVTLHGVCLDHGRPTHRHQSSVEQMKPVATALDEAGVPLSEVTHGDGLRGASVNYGFPAASDEQYLKALIGVVKQARVSALLLPGIGTVDHLKMARDCGIHCIRVATHCTEADVSEQHIGMGREMGLVGRASCRERVEIAAEGGQGEEGEDSESRAAMRREA